MFIKVKIIIRHKDCLYSLFCVQCGLCHLPAFSLQTGNFVYNFKEENCFVSLECNSRVDVEIVFGSIRLFRLCWGALTCFSKIYARYSILHPNLLARSDNVQRVNLQGKCILLISAFAIRQLYSKYHYYLARNSRTSEFS